jgi:hypothetical protein
LAATYSWELCTAFLISQVLRLRSRLLWGLDRASAEQGDMLVVLPDQGLATAGVYSLPPVATSFTETMGSFLFLKGFLYLFGSPAGGGSGRRNSSNAGRSLPRKHDGREAARNLHLINRQWHLAGAWEHHYCIFRACWLPLPSSGPRPGHQIGFEPWTHTVFS